MVALARPALIFFAVITTALLAHQVAFTDISWDEGWNFCVARNLIEQGHFGCSISGQLTSARLANGWLPVLAAALGFELFGINFVAGRVFVAVLTLLTVVLLIFLTRRLMGGTAALFSAALLLLLSAQEQLHPLTIGGQVWGEMPMIFLVVTALILLSYAVTSPGALQLILLVSFASMCFGVALQTKVQLQPFFLLAFFSTSVLLAIRARWRSCGIFAITLLGSWWWWQNMYPPLPSVAVIADGGSGTKDAVFVFGVALNWTIRWLNLQFAVLQGWFLIVSCAFLFPLLIVSRRAVPGLLDPRFDAIAILLFTLVASWLSWFLLLSIDFARYLAPPLILGVPLVALATKVITRGFLLRESFSGWWAEIQARSNPGRKICLVCLICLSLLHAPLTATGMIYKLVDDTSRNGNRDMIAMKEYINSSTPQGALIETYETMLFFMLDRPFHYPPDQLSLDILRNRTATPAEQTTADYDPFANNPDFILIGPWARDVFGVYGSIPNHERVSLEVEFGGFKLFRVR